MMETATGSIDNTSTAAAFGGMLGAVAGKWEGSEPQQVLSSVSAALPDTTKEYLESAKSRIFNPAYIRSPRSFFGFGEERPFFVEREASLVASRLKHNCSYFYLNYIILNSVFFVLTLLISPGAIIGIGILGVAWAAVIRTTSAGPLIIRGVTISQKQASIGMSIFSVFVLFYILSHVFWWTLGAAGLFVGAHAFLRDASMLKDDEDKVSMSGEIGMGEGDSFLTDEPV